MTGLHANYATGQLSQANIISGVNSSPTSESLKNANADYGGKRKKKNAVETANAMSYKVVCLECRAVQS